MSCESDSHNSYTAASDDKYCLDEILQRVVPTICRFDLGGRFRHIKRSNIHSRLRHLRFPAAGHASGGRCVTFQTKDKDQKKNKKKGPNTLIWVDTIEVALDVSADGKLNLPPYNPDSPSLIHNITIFLYSYETGRNFTITNGTASENNATLGDIMLSEPGSTVKHVKWTWPDCLIGDGQPDSPDSDRGDYNVS